MRLGRGGERERRVHDGADGTRFDEGPDVLPDRSSQRGLLRNRPRPQCRARYRESPLHDWDRVDRSFGAAKLGDLDETAIRGEDVDVALEVFPADHVEHDIHACDAGQLSLL